MVDILLYFFIAVIASIVLYVLGTALYSGLRRGAKAYPKTSGTRVITCPETGRPAVIEVDARHAAWTAAAGQPSLRVKDCERWPLLKNCGQECLLQVDSVPESCLVRTMLLRWYEGNACAYCGKTFGEIHLLDHKPALLSPERQIVEWRDIKLNKLPDILETYQPVCWDCDLAETFRREHPELVVDRPWKSGARAGTTN